MPRAPDDAADAAATLRAAWDELLARLAAARQAIDDPALHAPPPDPRTLAEGYRYLLGFVYGAIGRTLDDPLFPHFRRAIEPTDKSTIDNADAVYLYAPIDGEQCYRIRARPARPGRKPPHYVIFETPSGYVGDSGSLAELRPGTRANGGVLDSAGLQLEADGGFEILLAPERPAGHRGNFLATRALRRRRRPDGGSEEVAYTSRWVVLRELFHDWEHEDPLELEIVRIGAEGLAPAPLDPARAAAALRRVGEIVEHQMRYWNAFYAVPLETYRDMDGDGRQFLPRNDLNAPNTAGHWGGQATNVYAGVVYELAPDEALLVEVRVPVAPAYTGFHLANLWGESHDFANHQSSLNGFQAERDPDGAWRYVVSHRDPGVPNWLDTTGIAMGFLSLRWSYSEKPARLPETRVSKLRLAELAARLPPGLRRVGAEERRAAIRVRQAHVQRRYRHY
jgi:hypothetical protein